MTLFNLGTNKKLETKKLQKILLKLQVVKISLLNRTLLDKKNEEWKKITSGIWTPEKGDKIEGKLVEIKDNVGLYQTKLYILEIENKKKIKIWGKTQLDELMDEIELNDYIRITFNGFKTTNNGHQMKIYNLERRTYQ